MSPYVKLETWQVALAAGLILINGAISIGLGLGMEKRLAIASLRTIVQLSLVGLLLQWVFEREQWYIVMSLALVMTLIAAATAATSSRRRYVGIYVDSILAVWSSSWILTGFVLFFVVQGIEKWYQPQYAIPLLGMVLGNTLNGISVGLSTFTESLETRRRQVDGLLALGATRWEAARQPAQHAVRTGMLPIINSMMVVGVVSLPGMMTGQLVTGMAPTQAVKYQIVIMFLVASATGLGTVSVVLLCFRRMFSPEHQLRPQFLA